jgi:hypothetical protein
MFTLPLTVREYHELLDVRYSPDAAVAGWALYGADGRIRGWHRREPGNRHWTHRDDAFAAFIPDSRKRRHLTRIGYRVTATHGVEQLSELLRQARGDTANASSALLHDSDDCTTSILEFDCDADSSTQDPA